ncbi:hypothetical protein G7054_g2999 [Neopestalotiopsis clavispora]|nr:hypothetical protein G7054_g2999 [Neopestalotiopsis clavispora]
MSEVQSRSQPAARGRGGGRGGRGGFAGRNDARSTNSRRTNGDKSDSVDEDGDVGQLRQQFGEHLETIKAIFPDWSDADILYALQENDGDVEVVATRISEGSISQWGEVSKPKKVSKPKTKDAAPSTGPIDTSAGRPTRGGRADARGGRGGRGSDRARGGRGRGASSQPATNGHRTKENAELSVPTAEASAWGAGTTTDDSTNNEWGTTGWGATDTTKETATTAAPAQTSTATTSTAPTEPAVPKPKTWASMLRQSTAPKPAPKAPEPTVQKPVEPTEPEPPAEPVAAEPEPVAEQTPEPVVEEPTPEPVVEEAPKIVEPEVALPPSEVDLTKTNLEQLPDESHPPATATVASTTADSWDPRQAAPQSATATPLSAAQAQHQAQAARPAASGFAASALKATERPVRVPSYQRRVLEQEEAVRLPGNREVDRAAVQFGAFSLSGAEDDIDGDREEAETRAQPPSDSPIQPRASLPPLAAQPTQPAVPEAFPSAATQKPAATLPQPVSAAGTNPFQIYSKQDARADLYTATPVAPPTGPAAGVAAHQSSFNQQYSRFGQAGAQDQSFPPKPYDNFSQQPAATTGAGFDSFPAPASQPPSNAFSSAPSDYSSYYTADHSRGLYNSYYGQGYGQQQAGQGHNEGPSTHQRSFGGYNASQNSDNLSQYPQSAGQSRYGANSTTDAHNSGHNTPNPTGPAQAQPSGQSNAPQSNLHQQQAPGFPGYQQHPYNNSPFYSQYMNFYGGYGQGGYGGAPYGKGGVYGQPHGYQHSPYEHSSSPATSGFGQAAIGGRDSGLGSSIDNYGRAGSAQSGAQGLGNSGFGGAHDAFNRAGSSYQSQAGQGFNGPNAQSGSANDDLKPYGESKAAGGPSPSLTSGARPGSATNTTPGQSGLPPPQSSGQGMGGYGGYPSHLQGHNLHGNQTGNSGFGQGHNNYGGAYGNYGGNQAFGGNYGRGWGSNYQ